MPIVCSGCSFSCVFQHSFYEFLLYFTDLQINKIKKHNEHHDYRMKKTHKNYTHHKTDYQNPLIYLVWVNIQSVKIKKAKILQSCKCKGSHEYVVSFHSFFLFLCYLSDSLCFASCLIYISFSLAPNTSSASLPVFSPS